MPVSAASRIAFAACSFPISTVASLTTSDLARSPASTISSRMDRSFASRSAIAAAFRQRDRLILRILGHHAGNELSEVRTDIAWASALPQSMDPGA